MRQPRTWKDFRNHPFVRDTVDERGYGNGYWVYCQQGMWSPNMECGTIHEMTITDLRGAFDFEVIPAFRTLITLKGMSNKTINPRDHKGENWDGLEAACGQGILQVDAFGGVRLTDKGARAASDLIMAGVEVLGWHR